jgi:GxxExxY protein
LSKAGLDFAREVEMPIHYDEQQIGTRRADFLVDGKILVELKAIIIKISLSYISAVQTMNDHLYLESD